MALVILGGLISSMFLNLLVMPVLYWKFGKVREKSLEDIWRNSKVLNSLRKLKDEPLSQFDNCKNCDYLSYCNGGCRAAAYYASGNNLRGIDPRTCLIFSNWAGQRLPVDYFKEGALNL